MAWDFPASPSDGQQFTPAAGGPTYVWLAASSAWKVSTSSVPGLYIGDTAPASPVHSQMWWDSTNGNLFVYYNDGTSSQWVQLNSVGN